MLGVRKSCLKLGSWDWASGVSGTGGAALSALTRRQCCMANVQEVIGVTNREFSIPRAPQKIRRVLHRQPYSNRECRDVFGGQAGRWFSGLGSRDCDATDVASFGILASCIAKRDSTRAKKTDNNPAATIAPAPLPMAAIDRAANPSAAVPAPMRPIPSTSSRYT